MQDQASMDTYVNVNKMDQLKQCVLAALKRDQLVCKYICKFYIIYTE